MSGVAQGSYINSESKFALLAKDGVRINFAQTKDESRYHEKKREELEQNAKAKHARALKAFEELDPSFRDLIGAYDPKSNRSAIIYSEEIEYHRKIGTQPLTVEFRLIDEPTDSLSMLVTFKKIPSLVILRNAAEELKSAFESK